MPAVGSKTQVPANRCMEILEKELSCPLFHDIICINKQEGIGPNSGVFDQKITNKYLGIYILLGPSESLR